jgi:DivIVA domain-containing protein
MNGGSLRAVRWNEDRTCLRIASLGSRLHAASLLTFIMGAPLVFIVAALVLERVDISARARLVAVAAAGALYELWICWRAARVAVEAGPEGVRVQNWYRRHDFLWSDIIAFEDGSVSVGEGAVSWALAIVPRHSGHRLMCSATSQASDSTTDAMLAGLRQLAEANGVLFRCTGARPWRRSATPNVDESPGVALAPAVTFKEVFNGYNRDEVNAALVRLTDALKTGTPPNEVFPDDPTFPRHFRGYRPQEVEDYINAMRDTKF